MTGAPVRRTAGPVLEEVPGTTKRERSLSTNRNAIRLDGASPGPGCWEVRRKLLLDSICGDFWPDQECACLQGSWVPFLCLLWRRSQTSNEIALGVLG